MNLYQLRSNLSTVYRPFDHIPNELLALILVRASVSLDNDNQRFLFPLLIPQLVSRRWKEVAFATPSLWVTLRVDGRLPFGVLQNYLERSGTMAISIEIIYFMFPLLLVPHAARWEQVTLWARDQTEMDDIIKVISSLTVSLRHFLGILRRHYFHNKPSATIGLLNPALETLHLTHVCLGRMPALSFSNLTELVLRMVGVNEEIVDPQTFLDMLEASSKLKRLTILTPMLLRANVEAWLIQDIELKAIKLQDLEELTLSDCFITEFLFLSSLIGCPNLLSLGVGLLDMYDDFPIRTETWDYLSPSYPHLQRLDLWTLPEISDHLLLVVQKLPPIATLGIRGGNYSDGSANLIDLVDMGPWSKELFPGRESVDALQTRGIDMSTVCMLIEKWFPKTRTVFMYWEDVDATGEMLSGAMEDSPQLDIILWGKEDSGIWHLEHTKERGDRVGRMLP